MKHRVRVDFVPHRRWPAPGLVLVALACGVVAWQGWLALEESDLLQRQRAGLAALRRKPVSAGPAMTPQDIRRHAQIDAVARYLATPWDGLLALLESHAGSQISLVKFEPDASSGRVGLIGRAVSPEDLAKYLIALESDSRLEGVLLQRHEILRSEPGSPVEFLIGATWNAGAREPARTTTSSAVTPPLQEVTR